MVAIDVVPVAMIVAVITMLMITTYLPLILNHDCVWILVHIIKLRKP